MPCDRQAIAEIEVVKIVPKKYMVVRESIYCVKFNRTQPALLVFTTEYALDSVC